MFCAALEVELLIEVIVWYFVSIYLSALKVAFFLEAFASMFYIGR